GSPPSPPGCRSRRTSGRRAGRRARRRGSTSRARGPSGASSPWGRRSYDLRELVEEHEVEQVGGQDQVVVSDPLLQELLRARAALQRVVELGDVPEAHLRDQPELEPPAVEDEVVPGDPVRRAPRGDELVAGEDPTAVDRQP